MEPVKMRLIQFSAVWCGFCKGMERAQTVEKFIAKHPEIDRTIYLSSEDGDAAELKMNDYDVNSLPSFIFEDDEGNVVLQEEGATNVAGLEKWHQKALKALEDGNFGSVKRKKRRG